MSKDYIETVVLRHTKSEFIQIWLAVMDCLHHEPGYQINQPVLITHGSEDYLGFGLLPRQGRAWANRDPNSQYVVIPEAGHNAQQENPTFFNRVLLEFLARGQLDSEQNEEIEYAQTRQPGQ